ncbi:hypothetical protein [Longibacter sp.]|uniref:hypothetical protein n=1 Tax=Longibacter sp. TaxID=2045415 RepID=UPI003EBDE411
MPVAFAGLVTALLLLAVGASLAAAAHPFLAPVVLTIAAGAGRLTISSLPFRRLLWGGIAFIALVTVPVGLLTHGVVTGATTFTMQSVPDDTLRAFYARPAADSVAFAGGAILSLPRDEHRPAAVVYREQGRIQWASTVPRSARVDTFSQMTLYPLLWRVRIDVYAADSGPGWLYVWRWGGAQRLYVLDDAFDARE